MCGLVGIIKKDGKINAEEINSMLDFITHRGPDNRKILKDKHICLGHCRLSIIDPSSNANQPMIYKDKAIIIYNGEIYNFLELKKKLEDNGYIFETHSDTEVLLLGYVHWGENIINKIKGFFSFAIWDKEKEILFCGRDPFGKKPFFYYLDENRFIFASEIKSLIKGIGFSPKINYERISNYLLKGYFGPEFSVYKDIKTLKPGHFLKIDIQNNRFETRPYSAPRFDLNQININFKEACQESERLIENSVKKRLIADVPLGMLLSGGVDSSLIALFANRNSVKPINAFTISFYEKEFDESFYAKQVAEDFKNINLKINSVSNVNLISLLPRLVQVYGEPFGDYSCIPTYQIFKVVKRSLKTVLTGDGGDEVFGGYTGTDMYLLREIFQPFLKYFSFFFYGWPKILLNSKYRSMRQLAHASLAMHFTGVDAFYSLYRDSWTKELRRRFMRKKSWEKTGKDKVEESLMSKYINAGKNDTERYLNLGLERLTELFLVKTDRASMAHSVEARCPMLDIDLFNFVSKLPEKILFHDRVRKSIPKAILSQKIREDIVYRRKMGFTPPLSSWLKDKKVSQWMENKLLNPNGIIYELFEPKGIKYIIKEHLKGYNHTGRLWKLLFLEEWFEKN